MTPHILGLGGMKFLLGPSRAGGLERGAFPSGAGVSRMQKAKLHVREFEAHGERWQAIRHPSRKSQPSKTEFDNL